MKKLILLFVTVITIKFCIKPKDNSFKIGVISDCQYCNCEIKWDRYYKKSPQRLKKAVATLNKDSLSYTIHLGDFIDQKMASLDSILPTWNNLKSKSYHVLGNHDFDVGEANKNKIIAKLNLKERYYSFTKNDWRFIVLDGNDLSFYGAISSDKKQQTDSLFNLLKDKNLPYLKKYNGALSNTQLKWIKSELDLAVKENQKVGFYCHFPIYPIDQHNIWNREQFLSLIKPYKNVKLYFNGHNHAGAYEIVDNVHYLTFKGMVDTENTSAFAKVKFDKDTVFVEGFEREPSRKLVIQ
ncbi:phosphoesterase [Polaribacter reichenbachii]|uniref:Phosphoesterase n=1 Tax=Polaribacter reichenbachii TaxID=996801 RepID=A0A1B8U4S6_9FLAO|nr:metallophosphoesterase [Polaribacter reichenbachii]APZ44884.1 phosphoesterase [Polaribacter reichenbachii]AUC18748.1 phosphoesterase [Polaribacter reichenbachii]OBY66862.1 phosphoesterase [Polaribacter reichenbachii]